MLQNITNFARFVLIEFKDSLSNELLSNRQRVYRSKVETYKRTIKLYPLNRKLFPTLSPTNLNPRYIDGALCCHKYLRYFKNTTIIFTWNVILNSSMTSWYFQNINKTEKCCERFWGRIRRNREKSTKMCYWKHFIYICTHLFAII